MVWHGFFWRVFISEKSKEPAWETMPNVVGSIPCHASNFSAQDCKNMNTTLSFRVIKNCSNHRYNPVSLARLFQNMLIRHQDWMSLYYKRLFLPPMKFLRINCAVLTIYHNLAIGKAYLWRVFIILSYLPWLSVHEHLAANRDVTLCVRSPAMPAIFHPRIAEKSTMHLWSG